MSRDLIIDQLKRYFEACSTRLVAAYLFGSAARGQQGPDSDVDVGIVEGRRGPPSLADLDRQARIQSELESLLERDVDLVSLDGAPPDLLHRVLVDRVLLHDGNPEQRIEFEIQARNAYFDIVPHLEQYRRIVLARA